jgi:hypothetical protein
LLEISEVLNILNLKEAKPLQGFDPEGLFSQHLASMRYNNLFTRTVEGTDDNNPNTLEKKEKKHVMMIWSLRLVPTLGRNKTKQGKEVKMQPMLNLLMSPIHVGVPPLHKRDNNQMLAETRTMKDVLGEMMRMTHPLLILREPIQYLSRKGR